MAENLCFGVLALVVIKPAAQCIVLLACAVILWPHVVTQAPDPGDPDGMPVVPLHMRTGLLCWPAMLDCSITPNDFVIANS